MPLTIDDSTTEFVTLAEVKRHAQIPASNTDHDQELQLLASAAQELVEGLIGPVLHRTVTQVVTPTVAGQVTLNTLPALSVTGIDDSGTPVTGFTSDLVTGVLSGVWRHAGPGVTVTYRAGRTSCPDAVRVATLIIAEHLWKTQRGNAPSALPIDDFDGATAGGIGYAIPRRAEDLLAPYLSLPGWV